MFEIRAAILCHIAALERGCPPGLRAATDQDAMAMRAQLQAAGLDLTDPDVTFAYLAAASAVLYAISGLDRDDIDPADFQLLLRGGICAAAATVAGAAGAAGVTIEPLDPTQPVDTQIRTIAARLAAADTLEDRL